MLKMPEIHFVLEDQPLEKSQHIAFYVRIGIFVYGQTAGRVLCEPNANTGSAVGESSRPAT